MNKEFQDLRKDYVRGDLSLERLDADPLAQLDQWLRDALEAGAVEPTAMALSTVTPSGAPHSRMVLLKGLEKDGLVFYTNYNSDKGKAIESNPQVSVLFFWPLLERQVRVEGVAQKVALRYLTHILLPVRGKAGLVLWLPLKAVLLRAMSTLRRHGLS